MNTGVLDHEASIEACIDALDETTTLLAHHPPWALAAALGVHLQGVLAALLAQSACRAEDIKQWLDELAHGVYDDNP